MSGFEKFSHRPEALGAEFVADVVFTVGNGCAESFEGGDALASNGDWDSFIFGSVSDENAFSGEGLMRQEGFDAWGNEPRETRDRSDSVWMGDGECVGQRGPLAESDEVDGARIMSNNGFDLIQ